MNILVMGRQGLIENVVAFLEKRDHTVTFIHEFDPLTLELLDENSIEFLISFGYGPLVKEPVLSMYPNKIINIHPTFLPYGKGTFGNFWSYFKGHPSGVSIAYINAGIDSGSIIAQKEFPYLENGTLATSHSYLMEEVEKLFYEAWPAIEKNDNTVLPQNEHPLDGSYHSRIFSEKFLDLLPNGWNTTIEEVEEMGNIMISSSSFWYQYLEEVDSNE